MLNHVRSWFVCRLWFKVLRDTRRTNRLIWAQVWQCDHPGGCHCTCALINWSVLWQLASEQGSTLFVRCVIKTNIFVLQNQFWQLIVIYIGVPIWNLNLKCASDHFLYAQLRISGGLVSTNFGGLLLAILFRGPYGMLLYRCHSLEWLCMDQYTSMPE